jgi:hypothetical protein
MPNGENLLTEFAVFAVNLLKLFDFQRIRPSAGVRVPNRQTTSKCADVVDSLAERRLSRAMSPGCFGPLAGAGCRPGQWYYEDATSFEPDPTPPRLTL